MTMAISTDVFQFFTPATPCEVWDQLTFTGRGSHIWGLTADATWITGAPLRYGASGGPLLSGQVLFAAPPHRLSFTLGDDVDEPSTYVTWEVSSAKSGSTVRLSIDSIEPCGDTSDDEELAWRPVLEELQRRLP